MDATDPEQRIQAIDVTRGGVMVLMALDHVRVYSGLPSGGPMAGIFFTRWITHFCAPTFVFLAGIGAFLHGRKLGNKRPLANYLLTRGLLLVVLELTVIRFAWTFNFDFSHFVLAGIIWMLGWCMVMLALLIWLPMRAVAVLGLTVIFFQQIFHVLPRALPALLRNSVGGIWEFFYPAGLQRWPGISILYVLVPWIGVMAAGYGFGTIMIREPAERRRFCLRIGLSTTALFLVVGSLVLLSFPESDDTRPALFRLLDQKKYPASQLFLMMTLGPVIALLPLAESTHGWFARALATFGRVPLFYYLLHIVVIHVTALMVYLLREGAVHSDWFATAPFVSVPAEARWGLPLLYLVLAMDVTILYVACRWFARVKTRHPNGWLRYL